MNNLILCGFMGCGKTTVGKRLAALLALEYLDLDEEIERESGLRIPAIFAQYGEAHFRELEHQAIQGLARRIGCVVSTGGGAMIAPRNVAAIDRTHDRIIFLDLPFDLCYQRIRESDRPLVRENAPAALEALFLERRTQYLAAADLCIDARGTADSIAAAILERYRQQKSQSQ